MNESPNSTVSARVVIGTLVACYVLVVVGAAVLWSPPTWERLLGIALLPGLFGFAAGIPHVLRSRPRGWMALFHLGLFPLIYVLVVGLPGALVAYQIGLMLQD
jgi:hypothetical protein